MAATENKSNESASGNQYMKSFIGMLTVMFMLYDKVEKKDQLSAHSSNYLKAFESISNQPYEIIMTCFRCVIVGMSLEEFTEMISGSLSKETAEKKYEQLLRSHFANTEEESRLNDRMNQLITQVEELISNLHKRQDTNAEEMKNDKNTIIRMSEERLKEANERAEHYKNQAEEYRVRLDFLKQSLAIDVTEQSYRGGGEDAAGQRKESIFRRRRTSRPHSARNSEIVRFRKTFAENEDYSEEQRNFLTMCFGDPDVKKRLSYEEIVMIASPKLSVNQMMVLKEKVLLERKD